MRQAKENRMSMLRANLAPRCDGEHGANVMGRLNDGRFRWTARRDRAATPMRPQVDDAVPSQVNRAKSCAINKRTQARRLPQNCGLSYYDASKRLMRQRAPTFR